MHKISQLNDKQLQAVEYGIEEGKARQHPPLLIIAGAGTGKTNTLAYKAANLILNGVDPEKILLVTFARRAAAELISRANQIVEQQLANKSASLKPKGLAHSASIQWAGTFHSISARLLREHAPLIGLERDFTIMDRNDSADMLDVIRHELGFTQTERRFPNKKACLDIYSWCVNSQGDLQAVLDDHFPYCREWTLELKRLFSTYAKAKAEQLCLDYDDLLLYCFHMAKVPQIAKQVREQFDFVLVDEYQDTNLLQSGVLNAFFPTGKGVTVVGDDAQSIYGFRSATVENILNFPSQFTPPAEIIALDKNYRSQQQILDLSNALLTDSSEGYKVTLNSDKDTGTKPKIVTVEDDAKQADYIVEHVLAARESGVELKQQAVLFRNGYHSDRLELELTRKNIPYVKHGGLKFLEASHVKDLLSILRWADNPKHKMAAFRVLKLLPGVGPKTAQQVIQAHIDAHYDFSALLTCKMPKQSQNCYESLISTIHSICNESMAWSNQVEAVAKYYKELLEHNYDDYFVRWGDIQQLVQISLQFASRERFLTELTLDPPQSTGDLAGTPLIDDDFLILSTVHSAKGQEWNNVFVLNVADGNFPNEYATGDKKGIEEERRLLYVAITRAKEELHLMQPMKYWIPEQQSWGDKHVYGGKSRFITDSVAAQLEPISYPKCAPDEKELEVGIKALTDIRSKIFGMWDE